MTAQREEWRRWSGKMEASSAPATRQRPGAWSHLDERRDMPESIPSADRFWSYVDKSGDCWVWTRGLSGGYGRCQFAGRADLAHRVSYRLLVGPIPIGKQLDHLCRNRACVNPAHLEPVLGRINILRGESPTAINARKTHCSKGHPFTVENTWWRRDEAHSRRCRECHRLLLLDRPSRAKGARA